MPVAWSKLRAVVPSAAGCGSFCLLLTVEFTKTSERAVYRARLTTRLGLHNIGNNRTYSTVCHYDVLPISPGMRVVLFLTVESLSMRSRRHSQLNATCSTARTKIPIFPSCCTVVASLPPPAPRHNGRGFARGGICTSPSLESVRSCRENIPPKTCMTGRLRLRQDHRVV